MPLTELEWFKRFRTQRCPKCKPDTVFPWSLVKTSQWCPECNRIWRYRYVNIDMSQKKAVRYWYYKDNSKEGYRVGQDGKSEARLRTR